MGSKDTASSAAAKAATSSFLNWGQDGREAAMGLQKAIEQAQRDQIRSRSS